MMRAYDFADNAERSKEYEVLEEGNRSWHAGLATMTQQRHDICANDHLE